MLQQCIFRTRMCELLCVGVTSLLNSCSCVWTPFSLPCLMYWIIPSRSTSMLPAHKLHNNNDDEDDKMWECRPTNVTFKSRKYISVKHINFFINVITEKCLLANDSWTCTCWIASNTHTGTANVWCVSKLTLCESLNQPVINRRCVKITDPKCCHRCNFTSARVHVCTVR